MRPLWQFAAMHGSSELRTQMASRLREAREAMGLKSAEMARLLDLPAPTYSRYETEVTFIPPTVMATLDSSCGITASYLLTGRLGDLPYELAKELRNRGGPSRARRRAARALVELL